MGETSSERDYHKRRISNPDQSIDPEVYVIFNPAYKKYTVENGLPIFNDYWDGIYLFIMIIPLETHQILSFHG